MRPIARAILALAGFTFAACGAEQPSPQPPPPPPPPAMTASAAPAETPAAPKPSQAELIQATMKSFGEAMNGRDAAKVAALFAPDGVWSLYGVGDLHGREAIQKDTEEWLNMSTDMKGAPRRIFMKGNTVASEIVFAGTMTGDFMGIKATKKPFGTVDLIVLSFNDDGLIASIHDYFDGAGFIAQIQGKKDAPPLAVPPAGAPEMHVAKGTPDEDKLVDWYKAANDTFNKDDWKALSPLMATGGEVTFYLMGGKTIKAGKDLDKFHADLFKAVPNAKWAVSGAWGVDGYVVGERTFTGTLKGHLGPVPPTNKDFISHVADIVQPSSDGQFEHTSVYGNPMEIAPPPPPKAAPAAADMAKPKAAATKPAAGAATKPAAGAAAKPAK
jgi:uncharacterized protein (TIGR02246 family)